MSRITLELRPALTPVVHVSAQEALSMLLEENGCGLVSSHTRSPDASRYIIYCEDPDKTIRYIREVIANESLESHTNLIRVVSFAQDPIVLHESMRLFNVPSHIRSSVPRDIELGSGTRAIESVIARHEYEPDPVADSIIGSFENVSIETPRACVFCHNFSYTAPMASASTSSQNPPKDTPAPWRMGCQLELGPWEKVALIRPSTPALQSMIRLREAMAHATTCPQFDPVDIP